MLLHFILAIVAVAYLLFVLSASIFIATAMISSLLFATFGLFLRRPSRLLLTSVLLYVLLDLISELLLRLEQERCCFVVQRVGRVRVHEKLWKERVEDVYEVKHRGPSLVDNVEANTARPIKANYQF